MSVDLTGGLSESREFVFDRQPDEAPETPLDEPRPPLVRDPPPEPDRKGPYVV